jgi:1-deoxy-D-xylulose-5-phosphate synthase
VGDDGPTHHGVFDIAFMRIFPGMTVMAPATETELAAMLRLGLALPGPSAIRYPREDVPAEDGDLAALPPVEFGRGAIVRRGRHAAILAYGASVVPALAASDLLRQEGILTTVADARFAKPVDGGLIEELVKTHPIVLTVEEAGLDGGFGSAVLEEVSRRGLSASGIIRKGVPDRFIDHGPREWQLAVCGIDAAGIAKTVRQRLEARS